MLVFTRQSKKPEEILLVGCNFSPLVYEKHKIGVPFEGKYKEIFNSDSEIFGGTDVRNKRAKRSKKSECDGREDAIEISVPPMGIAVYSCTAEKAPEKEKAPAKKAVPAEKNVKAEKAVKKAEEAVKKAEEAKTADTEKGAKKAAEKRGRGKKA